MFGCKIQASLTPTSVARIELKLGWGKASRLARLPWCDGAACNVARGVEVLWFQAAGHGIGLVLLIDVFCRRISRVVL